MKRKRNRSAEWVARANHHAKRLAKLAKVASDIMRSGVKRWTPFGQGLHIKTRKGVYFICPLKNDSKEYIGIQIRKAGKSLVRLLVEE